MIACIDSDLLIDYFDGIPAAAEELARYDKLLVSRISWMEVLVGARTPELREVRENFLRHFKLIELDATVARRAITLRQDHRLRLPDAIVWASALVHRALLITRNTKHFPRDHPGVRVPYAL
ncbi:MAG: type II toxin-antitoxin system VapC family toxin [Chthoniobacterales bacterium]|nr:type II toxin-antitoxin system VapC family toxin [Chthoniobacterales bacterium]